MPEAYVSSTQGIPIGNRTRHVAIIMDATAAGKAAPAASRRRPSPRRGSGACTVRASIERGVEYLTLFAFSSETAPAADEVSILMDCSCAHREQEVAKLNENEIRFRVVGASRVSRCASRAHRGR